MERTDLIDHIRYEIQKSGHPVSLKVSNILNSRNWYVQNSSRFKVNKNDEKYYEIDVMATKESTFAGKSFNCLCIECKKQEGKNWVFFQQDKVNENVDTLTCVVESYDEYPLLRKIEKEGLFLKHHYYQKPLCTYFFITGTKPKERTELIEKGIEQVIRAVLFYAHRDQQYSANPVFYYPVIVFDGNLFIAQIEEESIEIESANHVSLFVQREYNDPFLTFSNELVLSKSFIIDIVKLDWFGTFLNEFY